MTGTASAASRVTIVDFSSIGPVDSAFTDVMNWEGRTLTTPINLEGGEARTLVARIGVPITDALLKLINDAIKRHDTTNTLSDVASKAAQAKLDILGNPVSVEEMGPVYAIVFPSDYKKTIVTFRVRTGRDNVFETQLTYPSNVANLLPFRKPH